MDGWQDQKNNASESYLFSWKTAPESLHSRAYLVACAFGPMQREAVARVRNCSEFLGKRSAQLDSLHRRKGPPRQLK